MAQYIFQEITETVPSTSEYVFEGIHGIKLFIQFVLINRDRFLASHEGASNSAMSLKNPLSALNSISVECISSIDVYGSLWECQGASF